MPYGVARAEVDTSGSVTRIQKLGYCNFMVMADIWRFVKTDTEAAVSDSQSESQINPELDNIPVVLISKIDDLIS